MLLVRFAFPLVALAFSIYALIIARRGAHAAEARLADLLAAVDNKTADDIKAGIDDYRNGRIVNRRNPNHRDGK